jgi:hypothetical protein
MTAEQKPRRKSGEATSDALAAVISAVSSLHRIEDRMRVLAAARVMVDPRVDHAALLTMALPFTEPREESTNGG